MIQARCDFCRQPVLDDGPRYFWSLGGDTCLHCDRPACRIQGKKWRTKKLKEAAVALGLAKHITDSPVSQ